MDYTNFCIPSYTVVFSAIEGLQRSGESEVMVRKMILMECLMEYEIVQHILTHINTCSRI